MVLCMVLNEIIESCRYVSNNSKSVAINERKLEDFVKTIKTIDIKHWLSFSPYDLLDLPIDVIINFLLIFESIDFSFWGNPKWSIDTDNRKRRWEYCITICYFKVCKEQKYYGFF